MLPSGSHIHNKIQTATTIIRGKEAINRQLPRGTSNGDNNKVTMGGGGGGGGGRPKKKKKERKKESMRKQSKKWKKNLK